VSHLARAVGHKSEDAVAYVVARFNRVGLAAVTPRHGGGHPPTYGEQARDRILREAPRGPAPERDGTAAWSLTIVRRVLRASPDGLPRVSTYTIWRVFREEATAGRTEHAGSHGRETDEPAGRGGPNRVAGGLANDGEPGDLRRTGYTALKAEIAVLDRVAASPTPSVTCGRIQGTPGLGQSSTSTTGRYTPVGFTSRSVRPRHTASSPAVEFDRDPAAVLKS
jgi:hypothetical protein